MAFEKCYKLRDLRTILNKRHSNSEGQYGAPDKKIEVFYKADEDNWELINECRIYTKAKQLIVTTPLVVYNIPTGRIIGYDIVDVNGGNKPPLISATTTIVKTDTGSLVKRAIIGGVWAGGVGAAIGAATAKKTFTQEISDVDHFRNLLRSSIDSTNLEVIIKTDDIESPMVRIRFDSYKKKAEEFAAILNIFIKQNAEPTNSGIENSNISTETTHIVTVGRKLGIEPINLGKKWKEEYQKQMQKEREETARKEKWETIGVFAVLALIIVSFLIAIFSK